MVRIDRKLSKLYRKLGQIVAIYPKSFIFGSLVLAIGLGTGLMVVHLDNDYMKLLAIKNGQRVIEEAKIQKYFPINYTGSYSTSRITKVGRLARILITAKDGGTIFRRRIWKEIVDLDNLIHSIEIEHNGQIYNYRSLCAKDKPDRCYENDVLDISSVMGRIENRNLKLSYPLMVNPETYNMYILPLYFGGIQLSSDNLTVLSAKALSLQYFLNSENIEAVAKGELWEKRVADILIQKMPKWKYMTMEFYTYSTFLNEILDNAVKAVPYGLVTGMILFVFVLFSTFSRDWVKAKQIVGVFGILAATFGSLAGFGLLGYVGITLISFNIVIPFIMIGIGIDDSFVMLSVWRQTKLTDPVPDRLAETYADAAVSITITSLTDMLSFYVGVFTPISHIQCFCAYAGTCVFFIYVFQLTFFGAVLALSGYQESKNRHSVFWWIDSTPKSKSDGMGKLKKMFLTGGIDKQNPANPLDNHENAIMVYFRDTHSKLVAKKHMMVIIIILYLIYFATSTWGFTMLNEEMNVNDLLRYDSHTRSFLIKDSEYFGRLGHRVQVVIATPLNYSNASTEIRINEILDMFANSSRYVKLEYGENWLNGFTKYIEDYSEYYEFNITTEAEFTSTLKEYYFPGNLYATDVKFNEDESQIVASRYIVQLYNTKTNQDAFEAVVSMRETAASITDMEVFVYSPTLLFIDHFTYTRYLTTQLLAIAAAIAMLVVIIFIPDVVTSICVFFVICSTEFGVIGIMSLWGVDLNLSSVLCLMMCIGFSVDFSAHVSYAYISSSGTPEERIQKSMYSLGLPILQGGLSTILSLIVLNFMPSDFAKVFFKVVFLVISIAVFHSLFILPVALMVIKPEQLARKKGQYNMKPDKGLGNS